MPTVEMDACVHRWQGKTTKHTDKKRGKGRRTAGKQPVLGIEERRTGEVGMIPVDFRRAAPTACAELSAAVEPGTKVFTHDHWAYRQIDKMPWTHHAPQRQAQREIVCDEACTTNDIESVWALRRARFQRRAPPSVGQALPPVDR